MKQTKEERKVNKYKKIRQFQKQAVPLAKEDKVLHVTKIESKPVSDFIKDSSSYLSQPKGNQQKPYLKTRSDSREPIRSENGKTFFRVESKQKGNQQKKLAGRESNPANPFFGLKKEEFVSGKEYENINKNRSMKHVTPQTQKSLSTSNFQKESEKIISNTSKGIVLASTELSSFYLSSGSEENVGVEASEKVITHTTKTSNLASSLYNTQHHSKFFSNDKKNQKKSLKNFFNRSRMKKQVVEFLNEERNPFKQKLMDKLDVVKKGIERRKTHIGFVFLLGALLMFLVFQTSNTLSTVLTGVNDSVLATSYLTSQERLVAVNQFYSTQELNLENELNRLEVSHPGYDEYIVNKNAEIGHDVHMILAYVTSRFGELKELGEVQSELLNLYDAVYDVDYKTEIETRYRTKVNEKGETVQESYQYKKLIVTITKHEMKEMIYDRLAGYEDNIKHFETLYETKGNMGDQFVDSGVSLVPGDVSSLYDFNVSGGNFPPPNPNHIAGLNGGYPGQCTWYVYNRFSQLGKPIQHSPMGNGGDWAYYAQNYGYAVSRHARSGTAMSFPSHVPGSSPQYGHIAFVEKVNDDGSVFVSEMNVVGEYVISTRTIPKEVASQCYFIDFGL